MKSECLGFFFPSTRIEASDSCYLQKPLGDSDISLVVIIDLLLLAIMVENQNLQPHCKLCKKTHQIVLDALPKLANCSKFTVIK